MYPHEICYVYNTFRYSMLNITIIHTNTYIIITYILYLNTIYIFLNN